MQIREFKNNIRKKNKAQDNLMYTVSGLSWPFFFPLYYYCFAKTSNEFIFIAKHLIIRIPM